ncbi:hypothetical protein CEP54_010913 [Fusarium duplospermum]|uniref:Heterokaryon incompatibility domain-containing protein n=1 Tax=Fusarium duplospermum TaxID=1325734 RepID=A0A428PHC2_9HYPO|nr:hypothetical protein CEP54_010913 [Fusarium duplospermum]
MYQTLTGRRIYAFPGPGGLETTWTHPDSTYEHLVEESSSDSNDRDAPSFEAISYARGSTHSAQQVLVECSSQPQSFASLNIGQNLASALRHLRHEKKSRTLWADAVCVDRSNPEEQDAHVFGLANIFSRASRAVAWLGPASEDSDEAFEKLRHLGEQVVPVEDGWVPSPDAAEPDWYRPEHKLPFSKGTINSVEKLLRRDWFQRMWVLQEIILASSQSIIQCGHSQMPWLIFSNAVCSLESKGNQFPNSFQDALQAPVRMTPDPKPYPRDKVYGLLGLLPPEFRQKITPDYDAPVAKVYTDTALALIEHTRRLDLLGVWNPEKSRETDCPSWVLDFREPEYVRKPLSHQFCTLNSACHVRFQPPDELRVTGIKIATLDHGCRMPPVDKDIWDGTDEDMLEIIRKVTIPDLDTATYGTGEPLRQAYAISLVAGDVVAVILGCQSPMLLRPQPDGRYKILGECYMHGLSDGGALLGLVPEPYYVMIFKGPRGLWDAWGIWNICRFFRNKITGEVVNSDPRLEPEALREKDVELEEIVLI